MKEIDDITIKQAAAGNKTAFRKVYDHYHSFAWKIIYRTVNGDQYDAEQIMQNLFIKIFNRLHSYKFNATFSTWMYRIAYNESISFIQNRKKYYQNTIPFDDSIGKESHHDQREQVDLVNKMLQKLTPQERFLLVAREVNGITFDELSHIMGKSSGTLRVTIHRIKETIRKGFTHGKGKILSEINSLIISIGFTCYLISNLILPLLTTVIGPTSLEGERIGALILELGTLFSMVIIILGFKRKANYMN